MSLLRSLLGRKTTPVTDGGAFESVGAAVIGAAHLALGQPCQDRFASDTGKDWVVGVVSDGAGSAARALEGAQIVSDELCQTLSAFMRGSIEGHAKQVPTLASVVAVVVEGIEQARKQCLEKVAEGETLRSFHATVVGGVLFQDGCILFQIGDGGASAHRRTSEGLEIVGFSEPENGEYINETFFFTEAWWREHLRFTEISGKVEAIWLMTDGAYYLAVPPQEKGIRDITEREVERLVFSEPVANKSEILAAILSSPQAVARNDDDKTLVILRRKK